MSTLREVTFFNALIWLSFILAVATFVALFFVNAPYGRHMRQGWGPKMSNRLGWFVMESPAAMLFAAFFLLGSAPRNLPSFVFLGLWEAHYLHRAFIYPFRIADGRKTMPVLIPVMAFVFNSGNAYLNGRYLFDLSGGYPLTWLADPRFIIGLALFVVGYATNQWADRSLFHLRSSGEAGYKVPYGGLFAWVSCPNYFGEIIEWVGWAIATWSLPGLSFAIWTIANLAPRARAHHAWYRTSFQEYPKERKALIPGVW
jgi:protein-S-isoprenylcysteine O-methyltransferase Ste14